MIKQKTLLVLLLFIFVTGCSDLNNEELKEYRKIAWDSLPEAAKETVIGDWKKAKVKETEGDQIPEKQVEDIPKIVIRVTFKTTLDAEVGPIVKYIDPTTKEIVGYNVRK